MSRKYQSRRKGHKQQSSNEPLSQSDRNDAVSAANVQNSNNNALASPVVIRRYYRKAKRTSPDNDDSANHARNEAGTHHAKTTNESAHNQEDTDADKENEAFCITKHYKKLDAAKFAECQQSVVIRSESVDTTTSYLSGLSLRNTPPSSINTDHIKQQHVDKAYRSRKSKQQQHAAHHHPVDVATEIVKDEELTLDDICNDYVDVDAPLFDPESLPTDYDDGDDDDDVDNEWPSWVPKQMLKQTESSPSKKRKRNGISSELEMNGSPPSKKPKSPEKTNNGHCRKPQETVSWRTGKMVFSTVRKSNKRRARRRSSLDHVSDVEVSADEGHGSGTDTKSNVITPVNHVRRINKVGATEAMSIYEMETPIGSIRSQRIHRLSRKSNTDLLFDVLLRADKGDCPQLNHIKQQIDTQAHSKRIKQQKKKKAATNHQKLSVQQLNGLRAVGTMDSFSERLCLHLLRLGADALHLNSDGMSAIYIAMHYQQSYSVVATMIDATALEFYDELNQTYVFAEHGTMSLMDIALRMGDTKTVQLLLEHNLMPTRHSIEYEPKVELSAFCRQHRMNKSAARVLREQLFEAVQNLDIEYMQSLLCHGIAVDAKVEGSKSGLYYLVQQAFDLYDELDAKDQYDTIVCLLEHGANPNFLDTSKTPMLTYPIQRSGAWNIKLVDVLLSHGASLRLHVGETCKTLYCYAKQNCVCDEILKLITNYHNNNSRVKKSCNVNGKGRKSKKGQPVIQLDVTTNPHLMSAIETNSVCESRKKYSSNRKSAK